MDKKDIGAFWDKTSKTGLRYLSGFVEIDGKRHELVVFANKKDGNEKRPDWRIYPSEPKDSGDKVPF